MAEEAAPKQRSAVPEELRPHVFKPGQSGNPKGRPKGRKTRLERLLDHALKQRTPEGETLRQMGVQRLALDFAAGDREAMRLVFAIDKASGEPAPLVNVNVGDIGAGRVEIEVGSRDRVQGVLDVLEEVGLAPGTIDV